MKRGFKRKKGEPIWRWILRTSEKTGMTEEQANLLIAVYQESYNEGFFVGIETERINNKKKNNEN